LVCDRESTSYRFFPEKLFVLSLELFNPPLKAISTCLPASTTTDSSNYIRTSRSNERSAPVIAATRSPRMNSRRASTRSGCPAARRQLPWQWRPAPLPIASRSGELTHGALTHSVSASCGLNSFRAHPITKIPAYKLVIISRLLCLWSAQRNIFLCGALGVLSRPHPTERTWLWRFSNLGLVRPGGVRGDGHGWLGD
jgi:hypothetical protein